MDWSKYDQLPALAEAVESVTGFSIEVIRSRRKTEDIVDARRVSIVLAGLIYPRVTAVAWGEYFQRNHATVLHFRRTHTGLHASDPEYKKLTSKIWKKFQEIIGRRQVDTLEMYAIYRPNGTLVIESLSTDSNEAWWLGCSAHPHEIADMKEIGWECRPVKTTVIYTKS